MLRSNNDDFRTILSKIGPKLVMTWNITLIVYLEGTNKYPNRSSAGVWAEPVESIYKAKSIGGLLTKKLIDKKC